VSEQHPDILIPCRPITVVVGFESSIDFGRKDVIWSMAFEDLSSKHLENDHRQMVHDLYGIKTQSNEPLPIMRPEEMMLS
jgi:hypothetical protein